MLQRVRKPSSYAVFCLPEELENIKRILSSAAVTVELVPLASSPSSLAPLVVMPGNHAPLLGAAFLSPQAEAQLQSALKTYPTFSSSANWLVKLGPDTNPAQFDVWAMQRMLELSSATLEMYAQSQLELSRQRIDYENLLANYESFVGQVGAFIAPDRVDVVNIPTAERLLKVPSAEQGGLLQLVPTHPRGLAEIYLWIEDFKKTSSGRLDLSIELLHTDIQHNASLQASEMNQGWCGVSLEKSIDTDYSRADLRVVWHGDPADAPVVGLGAVVPIPEAHLRLPNNTELQTPLAMRIYRTAPGIKLEPAVRASELATEDAQIVERSDAGALPWGKISSMRLASRIPDGGIEFPISIREAEKLVIVHPNEGATTVGVVEDVADGKVERVRALWHLARPNVNPVEVAIGLAPADTPDDMLLGYLGEWTLLEAQSWVEARFNLIEPMQGPKKLVAASRMFENGSSAWAWAGISRIDFE